MQTAPVPLRQIVAAVIGNALEWYDFVVYGFLTVIISRLFFPSDSEYASLLLAMATFGVGFFMRLVGGILIGLYADRKGRKAAGIRHHCRQRRPSRLIARRTACGSGPMGRHGTPDLRPWRRDKAT